MATECVRGRRGRSPYRSTRANCRAQSVAATLTAALARFEYAFSWVCDLFRPRSLLTAAVYHATMRERAPIWREVVGLSA
jgi:hypothetical protein